MTRPQEALVNLAIKENYRLGLETGKAQAIKTCYAAMCSAAQDALGFDAQQVRDFLHAMDERAAETISSDEAVDEVFEQLGLRITFSHPFGYIEETDQEDNS